MSSVGAGWRVMLVVPVVLGVVSLACRSRTPADAERELFRRRAGLLAGSRLLALDPQRFGEGDCPAPRIQIGAAGLQVSLYPANGLVGRLVPLPDERAARSFWPLVVPRAGVCPSVPRRDGRLDTAALVALLREIVAARPRCPLPPAGRPDQSPMAELLAIADDVHVLIAPADETPWGEVVAVADAAADAGLPALRLQGESGWIADCADAIPPGALRARLQDWPAAP